MQSEETPVRREIGDIVSRLRRILGSRHVSTILTDAPARPADCTTWIQEAIKLRPAMFRNFADAERGRIVLSNFPKWAPGPMPSNQEGVNFENTYYSIRQEEGGGGVLVCRREQIPTSELLHAHTCGDHIRAPRRAVRRMRTFLSTTFACADGALEMFLSYMSLAAAGVRLPEVILIFLGPEGEGKTLPLCDLMGSIRGTGRAVAPPSIFQTPEEFSRQGRLYRGMR